MRPHFEKVSKQKLLNCHNFYVFLYFLFVKQLLQSFDQRLKDTNNREGWLRVICFGHDC